MKEVVVVNGVRTAIGTFGSGLKDVPVVELGALVINGVLRKSKLRPLPSEKMVRYAPKPLQGKGLIELEKKNQNWDASHQGVQVDEVIMGNVLQSGQGQNTARQAMIRAGISKEPGAFTINKVCASGLKAVALGGQAIQGRGTSTQKIVSTAAANYTYFNAYVNIVAGSKIDSLKIDCYGNQVPSSFANAVKSWWRISAKLSSPGGTTIPSIRFTYATEMLGNNVESQLQAYHSADSGHTWRLFSTSTNTTRDLNAKTIALADVPASGDILFSSSPDPVAVRASVILSVVGRSQIRVGPPNRYTVDYVNNSDVSTGDMLISLKMGGGIHIKQIEPSMPSGKALQIIPVDSLWHGGQKDSCLLWVASMAPREERRFDVVLNAEPDPTGKIDAPADTKFVPFLIAAAWFVGEVLRRYGVEVLLADDAATVRAMHLFWQRAKQVIEPSSALPLAVVLAHRERFTGQRVGVILSGGNVDLDAVAALFGTIDPGQ